MEIKALSQETFNDFTDMIERNSYSHNPNWKGCYCYYYHNTISFKDWIERTSIDNKEASYQAMLKKELFGFLLYDENKCVGWVNANDHTYYHRLENELSIFNDKKTALTICYIIDEAYRNKGHARELLSHAVKYYMDKGYDQMIALPVTSKHARELHYRGSINMYEEQGYQHYQTFGDVYVMVKNLK
jgi:GNAT superfamily N-acetyltransferase